MENEIMVSISCITYNHEDYIRDALEGFLMQKTNFAYEVLIHDDASTDRTADIIREYEKKYPDLIKPIYQTENQHSQGKNAGDFNRNRAKGKYLAMCEGDDYWTDPYKLQKQYDAMEKHPEVDLCAHAVQRVEADSKHPIGITAPTDQEKIFSLEEVLLAKRTRIVDTCSLFFRTAVFFGEYNFWKKSKYSTIVSLLGAVRGGILYLPECMASYRVMAKGSWTSRMTKYENREKWAELVRKKMDILDALNEETEFKYAEIIEKVKIRTEFQILGILMDYKSMRDPKYADALTQYPRFYIEKVWAYAHFPWIGKVKRRLKR